MHTTVILEPRDFGRVDIVLSRADKLNALNLPMLRELEQVCLDIENRDDPPRVVVVRSGSERAFSVGADMDEWLGFGPLEAYRASQAGLAAFESLSRLSAPVIALIGGHCFGGGLELALACDLRIGVPPTRVAFPEASLGTGTGWGGLPRLVSLIGPGRAKSLLLTARELDAGEAHALGLFELVAASISDADKLIERVGRNAPLAVRIMKRTINALSEPSPGGMLGESLSASLYAGTNDARHAKEAFKEKRDPVPFKGE